MESISVIMNKLDSIPSNGVRIAAAKIFYWDNFAQKKVKEIDTMKANDDDFSALYEIANTYFEGLDHYHGTAALKSALSLLGYKDAAGRAAKADYGE